MLVSVGECWWVVWQCYLSLCCDTSLSSAVNTHKTAADTSDNLDDATCTLEQLVWESENERVLNVRWSSWTKQSLVALLLFLSVWVWGSCLQRKVISEILKGEYYLILMIDQLLHCTHQCHNSSSSDSTTYFTETSHEEHLLSWLSTLDSVESVE